jgi:hypothetical protein
VAIPSSSKTNNAPGELANILNNYRSVTYNFTLAALPRNGLKDPETYRKSGLKYVIATSKGKNSQGVSSNITAQTPTAPVRKTANVQFADANSQQLPDGSFSEEGGSSAVNAPTSTPETPAAPATKPIPPINVKGAVEGFNKKSGGSLDLYLDGLEIESIITPNPKTGVAQSTTMKFEVYEPYSANGFIEALYTAALAAGWPNYIVSCYIIKIEFYGYPDNINSPVAEPVLIDATRYLPIRILGTEMDVSEQGTKYRVSAVSFNEGAFSSPNKTTTDISMKGTDVYEVLKNLFASLNRSIQEAASKETSGRTTSFNEYEIYFPKIPVSGKNLNLDLSEKNPLALAKMPDLLKENTVFKMTDPGSTHTTPTNKDGMSKPETKSADVDFEGTGADAATNPAVPGIQTVYNPGGKSYRLIPREHGIQFNRGSNLHQIIEAVIVDSTYLKSILENIEAAKKSNDGMVDYFQVMIHTEPKGTDPTTNEEKFKFKYIVCPYRVHYSMLPDQQNSKFSASSVKSHLKRTYDYIYTGKNIDVLGFKLNFNNLYFQAAIPKNANSDKSGTSNAAAASETDVIRRQQGQASGSQSSVIPTPQTISDANAGSTNGRALPIKSDPYYQIAYQVNQALLESVNMMTGDIEILGDPYFLSTAGIGNHNPKTKDNGITVTGEANFNIGPVVIRVNFRNPVDIDETTGLARFSELAPFSGLYRVNQCRNVFRDGVFKQTLKLMRYNGQLLEDDRRKPTSAIETVKENKAIDQFIKDSAIADVKRQGIKPNQLQLANLINKGLPTNGLPGDLSNILGSVNTAAKATFKTVSGIVGQGTQVLNAASQIGIPVGSALSGINVLNQGIRLSSNSLSSLNTAVLGSSALLTQAGNTAKRLIPGSSDSLIVDGTVQDLTNRSVVQETSFAQIGESLSQTGIALADTAKSVINNGIETAKALGQNAALLVNDVGNKIANITSSLANGTSGELNLKNLAGLTPSALASKLGVDINQLSGLTGLDGKALQQLDKVIGSIPSNVDLNTIKEQGIVLANLTADKIRNLPAVMQQITAPISQLGETLASSLNPAQRAAVIADATAKGIPIDSALRTASAFGLDFSAMSESAQKLLLADNPQAFAGSLSQLARSGLAAVDSAAGKFYAIKSQISQLYPLGAGGSIENIIAGVQQSMGNPGSGVMQLDNLSKNVTSQFGSLSAAQSTPLDRLMNSPVNNENDPDTPVFGGRTIVINIRGEQQDARVKAYSDARAAGKSEAESQNISASVGNTVGAIALERELARAGLS